MISTVGLQYAKAIFDLACEKNLEEIYFENLKSINQLIKLDENIFKTFNHPGISYDEKKNILNNVLENKVENEFLHFLFVLIDNDRFQNLDDIVDSYQYYLNELKKESNAKIFTKYNLLDEELEIIRKKLQMHFNKKINIEQILDENLVGGIIIHVDGKVVDGSILNQMHNLKNELKKGW